jgi:LEA14-like dessication related protein
VNTKAIYAAGGGIAAAAIALYFVMGSGDFRLPGSQNNQAQNQPVDLELAIEQVSAEKTDDRNADVQVVFKVYNPNRNTALLETVHYTIYVDTFRMTSGDIGASPEGFLASQEGLFTIIANSTITLKDSKVATKNNLTASAWDRMVEGDAAYRVEGSYLFRLTGTSFQFTQGEKDFDLPYPPT